MAKEVAGWGFLNTVPKFVAVQHGDTAPRARHERQLPIRLRMRMSTDTL
jgi:hypothetical protein